jgi:hypothetical protein
MIAQIIIKTQINTIIEPTIQFFGLPFFIISSALTSQSDIILFGIISLTQSLSLMERELHHLSSQEWV